MFAKFIVTIAAACTVLAFGPVTVTALDSNTPTFTKQEIDIMYPFHDTASIDARKNGHQLARVEERKVITDENAVCVLHCREEAPPGLRPACGLACVAHERAGTGTPFDYTTHKNKDKANLTGGGFDAATLWAIFFTVFGLVCLWHAAQLPHFGYTKVFWLSLGFACLLAAALVIGKSERK